MHLISIDDLTPPDIENLFKLSDGFLEIASRPIKKVPTLQGPDHRQRLYRAFHPHAVARSSWPASGCRPT